jgi:hypothetical protein
LTNQRHSTCPGAPDIVLRLFGFVPSFLVTRPLVPRSLFLIAWFLILVVIAYNGTPETHA